MDPAFLAALPDDIFHEVVRDHQNQQEMARRRQAQAQLAATAHVNRRQQHHHHHHFRHFPMPDFWNDNEARRYHVWGRNARGGIQHQHQIPATISNERAIQLLDWESICTLLLLYFLDHEKFNINRLQVCPYISKGGSELGSYV